MIVIRCPFCKEDQGLKEKDNNRFIVSANHKIVVKCQACYKKIVVRLFKGKPIASVYNESG